MLQALRPAVYNLKKVGTADRRSAPAVRKLYAPELRNACAPDPALIDDSDATKHEGNTGGTGKRDSDGHFAGCLLGGAVGDALGAPVEFLRLEGIRAAFGPAGLRDYAEAYGRLGAITDDTQMTMFTAEGLLRGCCRDSDGGIVSVSSMVHHAYLRWLKTQGQSAPGEIFSYATRSNDNGWLHRVAGLYARRAPGNTCLSALQSGRMGTPDAPLNNSKGCGDVMRVAPVGLLAGSPEEAFTIGADTAAITHGHPSGYLAAGCFAAIVSELVAGAHLPEAVECALAILKRQDDHQECADAVSRAVERAAGTLPSPAVVESLGEGWVAEEALAISVYCALAAPDDFAPGVLLAVNHSGDSDKHRRDGRQPAGPPHGRAGDPPPVA